MNSITMTSGADDAAIARWVEDRLAAALARSPGGIAITLPGGSTPFPILARLDPARVDFSRITVWPGDDRIVPADHPASNFGRIHAALAPLGAKVVALAADSQPPHFALAWLGMGADGHIASLFPSSDPRADDALAVRRITPDPLPPEAPFDRLSLTIPALLGSDELLIVARGADKAALLEAAAAGASDLPIGRLLDAATQAVTCFT